MGFNPYNRIRRARMTRRGDLLYVLISVGFVLALVVWAMW